MLSRWTPLLIAFAFVVVLLSLPAPAKACCGEVPNYFFTISVIGTPDCSDGFHTGSITWNATYRVPANHSLYVHSYGDGVVQDTDFYDQLPQQSGGATNDYTVNDTWTWQFHSTQTGKVRVQFEIDNYITGWRDRALIVFDCTSRGVQNLVVHNFEDTYE